MNLVELAANGGKVQAFGKPLFELTGRQMRFLFATGAFSAGKKAARAAASTAGGSMRIYLGAKDNPNFGGSKKAPQTIRPGARVAAKQAMQSVLTAYHAEKKLKLVGRGEGRRVIEKALGAKIGPEMSKTIGNQTGTIKRLTQAQGAGLDGTLVKAGFKKMAGRTGNQSLYTKGKETIRLTKNQGRSKDVVAEIVKAH